MTSLSSQRTTSTKTRIKTVRVSLKVRFFSMTQRTTSTKTRIKTLLFFFGRNFCKEAQRTTSTKTRIKTRLVVNRLQLLLVLREQLPLKQGLRLSFN